MNEYDQTKVSVYFNSACPVCNSGINSQKSKSTACEINWKDVHTNNQFIQEIDRKLATVRKYLHLVDNNGELKVGINAFIFLWENSPKETWKAKVFALPIINSVSQIAYILFANILYAWNRLMKNW